MNYIPSLHNRVVVAHMDGTVSVEEISDPQNVFNEAKNMIGCTCLDYFVFRRFEEGHALAMLVDDDAYGRWGLDKTKVNKIATYLYGTGHFILGDAVIVWDLHGKEGNFFYPFQISGAERIASITREKVKPMADEKVVLPEGSLPAPEVKVESYDTLEEMLKAMGGDAKEKKD